MGFLVVTLQFSSPDSDAEHLEQYAVEGTRALEDPHVAAYVAANPDIVRRLDIVLAAHRGRIGTDPTAAVPWPKREAESAYVRLSSDALTEWQRSGRVPAKQSKSELLARRVLPRWVGYVGLAIVTAVAFPAARDLWRRAQHQPLDVTIKEFRTTSGQRASLTLPDGSTILLAPGSRVRYPATFGMASNRTIDLEGQALFTVTHAAGAPFTVRTPDITTRVLGTSFSVRQYPTDVATKVVVAQGRVSVGRAVLETGDVAVANDVDRIRVSRETVVTEQLAWVHGRLVFDRARLRDAIPELERWYAITIHVADSALLDQYVMTTLDTESLHRAVEVVAFAIEARADVNGRHVTLHSR